MHLRDAIDQITTIRTQLAATEHLRSLRAVPVATSGLLAIVAAVAQTVWLEDPMSYPRRYLLIWCGAAVLSAILASLVVARRVLRTPGALHAANARLAAMQFVPSLVVGTIVTWFVVARMYDRLWLLPGLWQLLFGLGNLAAHRLLPTPALAIGGLFVASGTCCLWFEQQALHPWAMGLPFAVGQLALASILWWHHERGEVRS